MQDKADPNPNLISPFRSALYEGVIRHRRNIDYAHTFSHRVYYFFLDLDEVDTVFKTPLLFHSRYPSLFRFDPSQYIRSDETPSQRPATTSEIKQNAIARLQALPDKNFQRVCILTQISSFGFCFNPVSFYYFYRSHSDNRPEVILAEITNTPWGERHSYIQTQAQQNHVKSFHVSPFLHMEYLYKWAFSSPGETLTVHMENIPKEIKTTDQSTIDFDATLSLVRKELSPRNILSVCFRNPWMSLKSVIAIYAHAAWHVYKGTRFYSHPKYSRQEFKQGVHL